MRTITTVLFLLLLQSCNGSGGESSSSALSCSEPLAQWTDDGGVGIDFTGLESGSTVTVDKLAGDFGLSVTPGELCEVTVSVVGDDCKGQVHVISSQRKSNAGAFTTACVDLEGSYRYEQEDGGLVFGRQGSNPILYR